MKRRVDKYTVAINSLLRMPACVLVYPFTCVTCVPMTLYSLMERYRCHYRFRKAEGREMTRNGPSSCSSCPGRMQAEEALKSRGI